MLSVKAIETSNPLILPLSVEFVNAWEKYNQHDYEQIGKRLIGEK